jgi:hypothetical protein
LPQPITVQLVPTLGATCAADDARAANGLVMKRARPLDDDRKRSSSIKRSSLDVTHARRRAPVVLCFVLACASVTGVSVEAVASSRSIMSWSPDASEYLSVQDAISPAA